MGRPKKTDSAKKMKAKDRAKRYRATRVNLGDQTERWANIKTITGADSDRMVAKLLLDFYLERRSVQTVPVTPHGKDRSTVTLQAGRSASTPQTAHATPTPIPDPGMSSVTEGSDSNLSSIEMTHAGTSGLKRKETVNVGKQTKAMKMELSTEGLPRSTEGIPIAEKKRSARVEFDLSSTDLEDFYDVDYDPDDPTYQPEDWDISIVQSGDDSCDEELHGIDEDVFDIDQGVDEGEEDLTDVPESEGTKRMHAVTEADMTEEKFVVCRGSLHILLEMFPTKKCNKCKAAISYKLKTVGCTVISIWACRNGHEMYRWSSSPVLQNGVYSTNIQAMSSVLLSGNNFTKVSLFARFLGLAFPSSSAFSRVQNKYVVPVVERYWQNVKASALEEHRATQVIVSGDGRMDSPGHSAKYCTYTVMNQSDKRILAMEIVDKRETGLKSGLMEAKGFAKALTAIQSEGVQLQEIVTDAHPQISSIMKKSYPHVRHSYDMWHGAKNLGKKLSKIASVKGNEPLKPWLKNITNHFFTCAETCDGNVLNMKTKWFSVLNHVTNRHSWALGQCDHGPIEEREEKPWLKPASNVVKDLQVQVMEKRLLRTFPYYVTCQTTSELETFNNHLLMYAPKRNAFSYSVYKCRCQLAAIDYSKHLHRKQKLDKNGKPRIKRIHSKAANNWSVVPVKEPKQYEYIPELLANIATAYCTQHKVKSLRSKVQLSPSDPKMIAKTIAPHSPPPSAELQARKISRIKGKKEEFD